MPINIKTVTTATNTVAEASSGWCGIGTSGGG